MKGWSGYGLAAFLLAFVLAVLPAGTGTAQAVPAADTVQGVRFGDHGSYERAVIDLGKGGAPADVAPEFSWIHRNGDWVVRVNLPTAAATLKTDGTGLGKAISKYYVVRMADPSGGMFVDLHLTGAAKSLRVFELDNPARIVVDVTPGGARLYPKPRTRTTTVLMRPRAGAGVGPGTLAVRGYGRPFEASGVWRIKDSSGKVVRKGIYTTSDWTTAWGGFKFNASYPACMSGRSGALQVGELSPRDGSFRGVSVPIRFR
jgi:hypothetical protein